MSVDPFTFPMTDGTACPANATGTPPFGGLANGPTFRTMAAQIDIAPAAASPCECRPD
jgi:hypothetical protein